MRWPCHVAAFTAALLTLAASAQAAGPVVAAAASLQFAVPELVADFGERTGGEVRTTFGSSGNLARQIRQGAPFELFLSADEGFALALEEDGLTLGAGVDYADGRLALILPAGSPLRLDGTLDDLKASLADGRLTHFAIANPEHAPYGRAAGQVLRHRGIWDEIRPRLVNGENVGQAAQFAVSGNAQGGMIAWSLALSPELAARGRSVAITTDWHAPLRHRMVLLRGAGATAEEFFAYLQTDAARAILDRHGFAPPDG